MVKQIITSKKSKAALKLRSEGTKKLVTDEDIRNRAFEIYQENVNSPFNELDNWCYAERELNGYYQ